MAHYTDYGERRFGSNYFWRAVAVVPVVLYLLALLAMPTEARLLRQTATDLHQDVSVDCGAGNVAINGAIGQSFYPQISGTASKLSVWMRPNLYYVTTYRLELYTGEMGSLLAASNEVSINPAEPAAWQNLPPGAAMYHDFEFPGDPVTLESGSQYSWKLVRVSQYSGAFAKCHDAIPGRGMWLGYSPEPGNVDYSFKLFLSYPVEEPTPTPPAPALPTPAPSSADVVSIAVDCSPGNIAINNAIGQSFTANTDGRVSKLSVWIKPNLYYITSYNLEFYTGEMETLVATSAELVVNPSEPFSWQNVAPGLAAFHDFMFPSTTLEIASGQQYSWKLVRTSQYSGAFAMCNYDALSGGRGFWLGTSPEAAADYSFKVYVNPAAEERMTTTELPQQTTTTPPVATSPWFCVASLTQNTVTGAFADIESTKAELNKSPANGGNLKMICEMTADGPKADPHIVGGQDQGAGSAGGFEKFWWGWNDIHSMNAMCAADNNCAANTPYAPPTTPPVATPPWFCVASLTQNTVTGAFADIESAKAELNKSPANGGNLKMICEMTADGPKADPHIVGGQDQGAGSAGGFEKFWWGWNDIHSMNAMCAADNNCAANVSYLPPQLV